MIETAREFYWESALPDPDRTFETKVAVSNEQAIDWLADDGRGHDSLWVIAINNGDGSINLCVDKALMRVVKIDETEDELILRLEPKA